MTDEEKKQRRKETRKRWLERNPDYPRQYRLRNIERVRERARAAARKWRETHPDCYKEYYRKNAALIAEKTRAAKLANPQKFRERDRRYWGSPKGRAGFLLGSAKQRCKNVTITKQWIQERIDRGYCAVTGIPFTLTSNKIKNPWSPSLDRKIPGQGYTPENTQLVVWIYNVSKGSWGHEDVMVMVEALAALNEREKAA